MSAVGGAGAQSRCLRMCTLVEQANVCNKTLLIASFTFTGKWRGRGACEQRGVQPHRAPRCQVTSRVCVPYPSRITTHLTPRNLRVTLRPGGEHGAYLVRFLSDASRLLGTCPASGTGLSVCLTAVRVSFAHDHGHVYLCMCEQARATGAPSNCMTLAASFWQRRSVQRSAEVHRMPGRRRAMS